MQHPTTSSHTPCAFAQTGTLGPAAAVGAMAGVLKNADIATLGGKDLPALSALQVVFLESSASVMAFQQAAS